MGGRLEEGREVREWKKESREGGGRGWKKEDRERRGRDSGRGGGKEKGGREGGGRRCDEDKSPHCT